MFLESRNLGLDFGLTNQLCYEITHLIILHVFVETFFLCIIFFQYLDVMHVAQHIKVMNTVYQEQFCRTPQVYELVL